MSVRISLLLRRGPCFKLPLSDVKLPSNVSPSHFSHFSQSRDPAHAASDTLRAPVVREAGKCCFFSKKIRSTNSCVLMIPPRVKISHPTLQRHRPGQLTTCPCRRPPSPSAPSPPHTYTTSQTSPETRYPTAQTVVSTTAQTTTDHASRAHTSPEMRIADHHHLACSLRV